MKVDYQQIERLIKILKDSDLSEIEVQTGKETIRIARAVISRSTNINTPASQIRSAAAVGKHFITSPFVGTFYRSPGPQQKAFVEIGDRVNSGSPLCIIEAMKLMNEIEADVAGRISAIFVEGGSAVEFGDKLFEIDTTP